MVGELIRLRFAIQRHTPSWKRRLGLVLGLGAAVQTWLLLPLAQPAARADVLALALAGWLIGWLIGPILTSGAAVLRPEYFALLPLERRKLGSGLLISVFVGVGALVTGLGLLAVVGYAAIGSLLAVPVALIGVALLLVLVVALSRTVYALLGAAMRTRYGVELAAIQYGLLIAGMIAGWTVVVEVVGAVPVFLADGFAGGPAGTVLGLLPSAWPLRAVDAAVAGDLLGVLGWLGALAAAAAAAALVAATLLAPHVGNRTVRRRRRRRRTLLPHPSGPVGAVVGKELRIWWRDPWRSLEVRAAIWVGVFVAVFASLGEWPQLAALGGLGTALLFGVSAANLYGQDGTALWQLVVAESRQAVRADVRGRQIALLIAFGVPAVLLTVVLVALTGTVDYAVPIGAVLVAALGVGCGLAVVLSVLGVTPGVDPHRRVNPTDAGENSLTQGVAFWLVTLLVAPTAVMAGLSAFAAWVPWWFGLATVVVALVNGWLAAWFGGALAVGRLQARLPETFGRLRYPKTVTTTPDGDWLDQFAHQAEVTAHREAASRAAK